MRTRLKKDVASGQGLLFPAARLNDMPLAAGRVAKASIVFKFDATELRLSNLEEVLVWRLGLPRLTKADPVTIAKAFDFGGSRHTRAFKDVPASLGAASSPTDAAEVAAAAISGNAEFGLQTDDEKEYFLSKFGDLVGIITVKRTNKGWSAGLSKSNVPRVLSEQAVKAGAMPQPGHSALPRSLEAVVPAEYQYWKSQGDEARAMRDALVENGFFNDDCIKAVDGELRKVEVKYFLYEAQQAAEAAPLMMSFGRAVASVTPEHLLGKGESPMATSHDWLEELDKRDAEGAFAILSPVDRSTPPREMVRAAKTLKGDFLLEHNDTRHARAAFAAAGIVFKLRGHSDHVLCASFMPSGNGVIKLDDGPVVKTIDFQGIKIDIDRPVGFVQTGKDETGNEWSRTYQNDYGFFPGTKGGDGDDLDVFVGPDSASTSAFWVTQKKGDGSFDEYKVFVGFGSERDALASYAAHIPTRFFDGIVEVPIGALKSLLGLEPNVVTKRLRSMVRVGKIEGISADQLRSLVNEALQEKFKPADAPSPDGNACCPSSCGPYCDDVYDDHAIFYREGKTWSIDFTYASGAVTLSGEPVRVMRTYTPVGPNDTAAASARGPETPPPAQAKRWAEMSKRALRIAVTKDDAVDQQYVLGVVLEPGVVDAQNDTYSDVEVRQACERFMEQHRNMGLMHKQKVNDKVQILENYIAPADFTMGDEVVKKGSWMMAVRVKDPDLWSAVKRGELTGFSIGGSAIRRPAEEGV